MFRFRLAKVLRWRERREDAEARALRQAREALRAARESRQAQERLIASLAAAGERQRRTDGDVTRWQLLAAYLTAQEERLRALRIREREAGAAVEQQRQRLLAAHREREVLTRLEERHRLAWEEQERRRERRELDEIGGQRAAAAKPPLP